MKTARISRISPMTAIPTTTPAIPIRNIPTVPGGATLPPWIDLLPVPR